jgi:hypothetical protein
MELSILGLVKSLLEHSAASLIVSIEIELL